MSSPEKTCPLSVVCLAAAAPALAAGTMDLKTALLTAAALLISAYCALLAAHCVAGFKITGFSQFSAFLIAVSVACGCQLIGTALLYPGSTRAVTFAVTGSAAFFAAVFAGSVGEKLKKQHLCSPAGAALTVLLTGAVRELLCGSIFGYRLFDGGIALVSTAAGGLLVAGLAVGLINVLMKGENRRWSSSKCS